MRSACFVTAARVATMSSHDVITRMCGAFCGASYGNGLQTVYSGSNPLVPYLVVKPEALDHRIRVADPRVSRPVTGWRMMVLIRSGAMRRGSER